MSMYTLTCNQYNNNTSAPKIYNIFSPNFVISDVSYGTAGKYCGWIAQGYLA